MHVIVNKDGARYCQDGMFRHFANFGTTSACVKEFTLIANATRTRKSLQRKKNEVEICTILPGKGMDASGIIIDDL